MSPNTADGENIPIAEPHVAEGKSEGETQEDGLNDGEPPDGGIRACIVVVASFLVNGLVFGVINSVSVIYDSLQSSLMERKEADASARAALVSSLAIGMTFFMSVAAGIMTDTLGIRTTAVIGGLMATVGMLASSFCTENVEALYFTFGILFGVGASLIYTPSLVILGHYFKKYLNIINGIVTAGSPVITQVLLYSMAAVIDNFGLPACFYFLTALMVLLIGCALTFKPITSIKRKPRRSLTSPTSKCRQVVNFELFRSRKYLVWTVALPLGFLGYFVPFVHTGRFVSDSFPGSDGKLLITCIQNTSLLGRIVFGIIAHSPLINKVFLQQLSLVFLGVLTISMVYANSFALLIAISLAFGLFDGCLVSFIGPIAFDWFGKEGASQAIGFVLGLCSIPMTVGPFLAGFLYDHSLSYTMAYAMSGMFFISAAIVMCLIRCVKHDVKANDNEIECEVVKPLYKEVIPDTIIPHLTGKSNGLVNYTDKSNVPA